MVIYLYDIYTVLIHRNKSLFECWNKDYSARPTVSNLKESFTKVNLFTVTFYITLNAL